MDHHTLMYGRTPTMLDYSTKGMGKSSMAKIKRFVRCPECNELMTVNIDTEIKTDRWPLRLEGKHKDHGYVVLLDSQYAITEVKKKPARTNETPK